MLVRRFRKLRGYIPSLKGENEMRTTNQKQNQESVPKMPEMRWNKDGSPNFDHLGEQTVLIGHARRFNYEEELKKGVPKMPEMRWNDDGTPDFSHLNK